MAVYVDNARLKYGRMRMSHMSADSVEELHDMAKKIGMKREWFQNHRIPHYDVCDSMRNKAVNNGAVQLNTREWIAIMRSKL